MAGGREGNGSEPRAVPTQRAAWTSWVTTATAATAQAIAGTGGTGARPATGWRGPRRRPVRLLPLAAGWPLTSLLLLYPLWWALGLSVLIFPAMAIVMVVILIRRGGPVRVPPGFGLWLLFLIVVLVSVLALEYDPPGTVRDSALHRLPGVLLRLSQYGSLTVLLLFAGNLSERELPQRRLLGLLSYLFLITVAGGLVGTYLPRLEFTSPLEHLLPDGVRGHPFVRSLVHPYAAQLHHVLGSDSLTPRAAAPWGYTNVWANNYFILVVWFVVAWIVLARSTWQRVIAVAVLGASAIPVLYSLNRGLWLALACGAGYVAVRLARRGQLRPIVGLALVAVAIGVTLSTTDLGALVVSRIETGHSNNIRQYTVAKTIEGMPGSPVIGYGSTRDTLGSSQSIAVGNTPDCPQCGNATIGSNGQIWLELYAHGLLGLALYLGVLLVPLWHYRRDASPIGIGASTVLGLNVVASFYYNTLLTPLAFVFLSLVLVWRQELFAMRPVRATVPGPGAIRPADTGAAVPS